VQFSTVSHQNLSEWPMPSVHGAVVSRSLQYSERVIGQLQDLIAAHPEAIIEEIVLNKGDKLSREEEAGLLDRLAGRQVVVLEGELKSPTSGGDSPIVFGPGYTIFSPEKFLDRISQDSLEADSSSVRLITIPSKLFNQWVSEHSAFREAIAAAIKDAHPQSRFAEVTRESIRRVRDENMRHVVFKECIDVVNRKDGIFDIINPQRRAFTKDESTSRLISPEEQAFQIIEAISPVYIHSGEDRIHSLARTAREIADATEGIPEFERVAIAFQHLNALLRKEFADQISKLLPQFSEVMVNLSDSAQLDWIKVSRCVLQIKWLEYLTEQDSSSHVPLDQNLKKQFDANPDDPRAALRAIKNLLDDRLEPLVEKLASNESPRVTRLGFRRFDVSIITGDEPSLKDVELTRADREFNLMDDLAKRLASGDRSAVGGAEYVKRRIPSDLLQAVARGETHVVFYDGSHREAIEYARVKFGASEADPAVIRGCLEMEISGTYGGFDRSWLNFRNGESVLVISQDGSPIRNAVALLLFKDEQGRTVPFENIHMVRNHRSLEDRIQSDLREVLTSEEARVAQDGVFGKTIGNPNELPTFLLILDRPDEFVDLLGEHIEHVTVPSRVLGKLKIGYWNTPEGEIRRIIMPTVGSRGLYGDSAGTFVKAFFNSPQVTSPVPHLFFSASAGSFSDTSGSYAKKGLRGLQRDIERGALIMPEQSITYQGETLPIETIFARLENADKSPELQSLLNAAEGRMNLAQVHHSDRHYSIEAPALETAEVIKKIVEGGHATIDVEGGPIARAIKELDRGITCTTVFSSSDDPRLALNDPSQSLAFGGVLFENKIPQTDLQKLIRSFLLLVDQYERESV